MAPSALRLIILDLDGTLIDSLDDLTSAANRMRQEFSLSPLTRPEVRLLVGEGARRLVERALPGITGTDLDHGLALFLQANRDHLVERTHLYPGVEQTLAILKSQGILLAVASNKNEELCRDILRILDIESSFAAILGADSVAERKPSPEPLIHLMRRFDCIPEETMMVGDSRNDVQAGLSAGVVTVGCSWGYGFPDELVGAHHVIHSFPELLTLPAVQQ